MQKHLEVRSQRFYASTSPYYYFWRHQVFLLLSWVCTVDAKPASLSFLSVHSRSARVILSTSQRAFLRVHSKVCGGHLSLWQLSGKYIDVFLNHLKSLTFTSWLHKFFTNNSYFNVGWFLVKKFKALWAKYNWNIVPLQIALPRKLTKNQLVAVKHHHFVALKNERINWTQLGTRLYHTCLKQKIISLQSKQV